MYLFVVQIDMTFKLFAILQKYEFSSKSQHETLGMLSSVSCLRYCKSTSFQANHNKEIEDVGNFEVVCDTAKVRVFKQITTISPHNFFANGCLRYCKSTSFQANHNAPLHLPFRRQVVCDTAKVRVFKQITTVGSCVIPNIRLFAILQKYEFSSKSQRMG